MLVAVAPAFLTRSAVPRAPFRQVAADDGLTFAGEEFCAGAARPSSGARDERHLICLGMLSRLITTPTIFYLLLTTDRRSPRWSPREAKDLAASAGSTV